MGTGATSTQQSNYHKSRQRWGLFGLFMICVVVDIIGCLSVVIPVFETLDVIWAPISAIITYSLFGSLFGSAVNLIEEILPATDFIPTVTLMFLYMLAYPNNSKSTKPDTKVE